MNTPDSFPLAAYCSFGSKYKRFKTSAESICDDTEFLLSTFGVAEDTRQKIQDLLHTPNVSFSSGFKYESSFDSSGDPDRLVVYACIAIPAVDEKLPAAREIVKGLLFKGGWQRSK